MEAYFYVKQVHECPECGMVLEWEKRPDRSDRLMLTHPLANCIHAGKHFYAPGTALTEISGHEVPRNKS